MKANLTTILMDINDEKPMTLQDGQPATLRSIIQQALAGPIKNDENLTDEKKYQMFRLGRRCKADEVHFSAPEVTLICERVSKFFLSAYVFGQVKDLLDPRLMSSLRSPRQMALIINRLCSRVWPWRHALSLGAPLRQERKVTASGITIRAAAMVCCFVLRHQTMTPASSLNAAVRPARRGSVRGTTRGSGERGKSKATARPCEAMAQNGCAITWGTAGATV